MKRLQLSRWHALIALVGLVLIAVSWWRVNLAVQGVTQTRLERDGVPLRSMVSGSEASRPGVVVAHGFSGSQQLMLAYGHVLARAGYHVMLLDFAGHGTSASRLPGTDGVLEADLYRATAALLEQPDVDPDRIALLGHSMGSGAVMRAGIERPQAYRAVVSISPVPADVTPQAPPNLLLQAGALEGGFAARARALLAQGGGPNEDFAGGLAREFVLVPNVEHITVLFSDASHDAALRWLNEALGWAGTTAYRDRRMIWYLVQVVGALLLLVAARPLVPQAPAPAGRRRPVLGLVLAPFTAALLLGSLSVVVDVGSLGGLAIGGAFGLWIFLVGAGWLALGYRPVPPTARDLLWGMLLFVYLWAAFGLLAQVVWLPWLLNAPRLLLWPFMAAGCVLWQLAAAGAQQGARRLTRLLWWFGQSIFLVAGLVLTIFLVPDLGFLFLLAPVIPLVLAIMTIAGGVVERPWAAALGNGLFFAWLPLALFPLV